MFQLKPFHACSLFVAYSWPELHVVKDPHWKASLPAAMLAREILVNNALVLLFDEAFEDNLEAEL